MSDELENGGPPVARRRVCIACGAVVDGERCWLCGSPSADTGILASRPTSAASQAPRTFGLSSLFLFVTLVSVCLGVLVAVPGLGILLAILAVPAFVRASASTAREAARGRPASVMDRIRLFAGSLGVIALITIAGCVAFVAACFVSCPVAIILARGGTLMQSIVIAGLIALTLMGWLLYKTWPRR